MLQETRDWLTQEQQDAAAARRFAESTQNTDLKHFIDGYERGLTAVLEREGKPNGHKPNGNGVDLKRIPSDVVTARVHAADAQRNQLAYWTEIRAIQAKEHVSREKARQLYRQRHPSKRRK